MSRAAVIGMFDGVHRGHRAVLEEARATGLPVTAITFDPHPREVVLGNRVELITTPERRAELLREAGADEVVLLEFTAETAATEPEEFAERELRGRGVGTVVAGEDFRFGHHRRGDLELLRGLGFETRVAPEIEGVSSSEIRRLLHAGDVVGAAAQLGRPPEVDGTVVPGDARGGTLGYPTANLQVDPRVLVPANGIYAGEARGHRAAVSIGVNLHSGGSELRIEPHLLDFEGDLYGQRLVVELWERLRDERAFESEQALVEQIGQDVERARRAVRPG